MEDDKNHVILTQRVADLEPAIALGIGDIY